MSAIHNLEPQPTAKAILHTTSGDILLSLFAQQTPLASRNFLQLCLDGYYDGTSFHRLVPGFIVQGGDPSGTGSGGESSFEHGAPFADEFHSRLKFNRRGLLGMANSGARDDNGSQFFLTLGKAEELNGRNTMFGRVEGDTVFNLVRMGEAELVEEGSERPLYPTRIVSTEVLVNPFEDMRRRVKVAERTAEDRQATKKLKKKVGKAILSFVGDEEEEGFVAPVKSTKANPKLFNVEGNFSARPPNPTPTSTKKDETAAERPPKRQINRSPSPPTRTAPPQRPSAKSPQPVHVASRSPSPATSPEPPEITKHTTLLSRTNAQIAELKSSLKRTAAPTALDPAREKSTLEAMIPATASRGRKRKAGGPGRDDRDALEAFTSFKRKLDAVAASAPTPPKSKAVVQVPDTALAGNGDGVIAAPFAAGDDEEAATCDLHFVPNCESCRRWDREEAGGDSADEEDDADWMAHRLSFARDRLGKDLEFKRQNEQFEVIDPREKARALKEERKRGRLGKVGA